MKEHKVPIQSLIDHIKTAQDVDPWAKEMAEELLTDRETTAEIEGGGSSWWFACRECRGPIGPYDKYCKHCGRTVVRDG